MTAEQFIEGLLGLADEGHRIKLKHFGVPNECALGVRMPDLRAYAKPYKGNARLALDLFASEYHEAKMAAAFIFPVKELTREQADRFMEGLYSWDLVDQFCSSLFAKASFAKELPYLWAPLPGEFQRRSGIVCIASISMKQKKLADQELMPYLDLVKEYIDDDRNFVKKANSWTLRTLGKRSLWLNEQLINYLEKHWRLDNGRFKYWAAGDAYRELTDSKIKGRLLARGR